jgi:sugar-specific transcriptional regulator TrmB
MTTAAGNEGLLSDLAAIGFAEHEARIYVALVTLGRPATAYEVAKAARIPVANTYNVIRSLAKRGATKQVTEGPTRYVSVPPTELFQGLATEMQRRCTSLVARFEKLTPEQAQDYVELLNGRTEIERRIAAMIERAERQIVLKCQSELSTVILEALADAVTRGVRCLIIYHGEKPKLPRGDVHLWPHEGNGADMGEGLFTISVDSRQALAFDTESSGGTASENPIFVYLADVLLRHEIYLAEIMGRLGPEVEAHFGPALYRLRERYAAIPISEQTWAYIRSRLAEAPAPEPPARRRRVSAKV